MIETRKLAKSYKDGTKALRGVSITLTARSTAVLGRNGAGKTTMLRILSTQLMPTSGTATIDGYDVVKDAEMLRKRIVSIPQEAQPIGFLSPYEHIYLYLTARRVSFREAQKQANWVLKELGLWEARDKASDDLSGGMKRKIFVGMALASNPEVIFLDEPTVGLDPISRIEVWSILKKLKSQMVLTTHYVEEAKELAQDIVLIEEGQAVSHGTAAKLLESMEGMVRIESIADNTKSQYHVGGLAISYVKKEKASSYVRRGFTVKPIDIEDLFILKGKKPKEQEESEGGWQ